MNRSELAPFQSAKTSFPVRLKLANPVYGFEESTDDQPSTMISVKTFLPITNLLKGER